ncbi:hypothetical protein Trco_001829 [Trichoderma cornu-damae]|uniref:Short-chain dehydrogenase n=1 Tax=Trichoderma cornu-damae TaxID=654480 RepID=A0A9P8TXF9_9HYPO|nr:hypothetical protein Trco_001829 [Trichoderma cornu-damae]
MLKTLGNILTQGWPPKPVFTEQQLEDLSGKVVIVTGGYSGVGYQLSKLLYAKNAVVYIAGRRQDVGQDAIESLRAAHPDSRGRLEFLQLDLADLPSIKASASAFLGKETRLDNLWNNAGLMRLPKDSPTKSKQDHELLLAVNCLGPYLFTKLLHPILVSTARSSPVGSVRVVWTGSLMIPLKAPTGGMDIDNLDYKKEWPDVNVRYAVSKTGNFFLCNEWAKLDGENGILHLAKLFAGLSPDVKPEDSGRYVIPWGRFGFTRADIDEALTPKKGEETSTAGKFFEYCENETKPYV